MFIFGWELNTEQLVEYLHQHKDEILEVIRLNGGYFPYNNNHILTDSEWIELIQDNIAVTFNINDFSFDIVSTEEIDGPIFYFGISKYELSPIQTASLMSLPLSPYYSDLVNHVRAIGSVTEDPVLISF